MRGALLIAVFISVAGHLMPFGLKWEAPLPAKREPIIFVEARPEVVKTRVSPTKAQAIPTHSVSSVAIAEVAVPSLRAASVSDIVRWGNAAPEYPFAAVKNGWEGKVELLLRGVAERAAEVFVVTSSGNATLDEAAVTWARNCRFPSGDMPSELLVPIVFQLEN